jgi:carboxypeptidase T
MFFNHAKQSRIKKDSPMKNKRLMILSLAVLVIICALAGSSILRPASANPAVPASFSSDLLANPDSSYWVVRAYYQDRQMVNELARWLEPWEVHHDQGYLVVGVNQQQYDLLLTLGFRLEIDQELTDLVNRPLKALPGQTNGIPGYPCYRTVEETLAAINSLVASYPTLASKIDIGDSWDKTTPGGSAGYDLVVLKLTNSAIAGPKP